jgi:hypothetical protein
MISFNNRLSDNGEQPFMDMIAQGSNPLEDTFLMESPQVQYKDSTLQVLCDSHKTPAIFYSNQQ